MKRLTFVASILFCLVFWCATFPVAAKDTWTSVKSRNFFLLGNASEKEIRQVGIKLEQFREVFTLLFRNINFSGTVPTTVIVFKSDSSYRPFKPNANLAGYFQPGQDVNYITLTTEVRGDQNPFNVIFHEYTHLLVNNTMSNAPTWFNEGLAEYYSTFSISNDQKIVLGNPIANHVFLLRENKMLPLKTLFQVDHKSPYYNERDKQSIFYAESWALVHYLILGNDGQRAKQIGPFIKLVDSGVPMDQAFQQAFKIPFETIEKELREYIKRDSYPMITGTFAKKLEFDTESQAAPLGEAEAQAYLGDLLLHGNRPESESYLQKALTLDPNLAMANASLGMLRVRQGKIDEARQSLERAATANSQNYLIHYYYAYALSREGMGETQLVTGYSLGTLARIRDELKKAIQLRPDFAESYGLLGFVNLVSGSQLDESIDLLKRILTTSPGRNDLLLMLAQIYLRKEDYKAAGQILERLSQNNSDAEVRQRAAGLLADVVSLEEQVTRYQASRETTLRNATPASNEVSAVGRQPGAAAAASERVDPSSYLREALRTPASGEQQVQGALVRVDCDAKGIVFVVQTANGVLRLWAKTFEDLEIVAFTTEAGSEITCGVRKPQNTVVVCYVPGNTVRAKVDGSVKSMEFVPVDFKLNP
ncbi:MAG TPA: tetratricopeptide repeat protein [Pyrinomonadaceae bacterium]|nr:tetratricopeptide repeat protein [Pyrinomonadaceae bacterium]